MTEAVLANTLETPAQRHRKARAASFELLERATTALDAATKAAQAEAKLLKDQLKSPPATKDLIVETRQRELRERLQSMPPDRQRAILDAAVAGDDDNVLAAVLTVPVWLTGMPPAELDMLRYKWAAKRHPGMADRLGRIEKAVADAARAGQLSIGFIDSLTDAKLIAEAEKLEKGAGDALRAAKG